jgi:cytidylate kinase
MVAGKIIQIAIDGPVAAGKGSVARALAEKLGILYVDTGAMYRAAALLARRAGVKWENETGVAELVNKALFEMYASSGEERDGRLVTLKVDGEDVSWAIRTEEMSEGSSAVAVHPQVRKELVKIQKEMAEKQSVVMEGRDITTVVLPRATLKVFLTAEADERARRRYKQLLEKGEAVTYEKVLTDLKARDFQDSERKADPLRITQDAWVLNTTGMTIDEVVEKIKGKIELLNGR